MKLPALLLAGSLAANLACALVLVFRPALAPAAVRDFFHLHDAAAEKRLAADAHRRAEATAKTQLASAAASRALLWSALDSSDLKTLVAHLRAAGFSVPVIRALVNARLDARFFSRRQEIASVVTNTPYWKAPPLGGYSNAKYYDEMNQLVRDRTRAAREILGDNFFADTADEATAAQRRQFGGLPKAKIDVIQRINDDYAEMTAQVRAAMQGITLPEDREKIALLEREKHADLAALLSPEELRDYEMRSSPIASRHRTALGLMNATEAEFIAIYTVQQQFADQLNPPGGVRGAEMSRVRREAQQKVDEQIAAALGPARAADFARASEYDYQQLYSLTQRENLPPETAARAFDLRAATAAESRRIATSTTTTDAEKFAALQALAQTTRAQLMSTLGPTAGGAYAKSADWLNFIAGGGSITLSPGGSTFYSGPGPTSPAPAK